MKKDDSINICLIKIEPNAFATCNIKTGNLKKWTKNLFRCFILFSGLWISKYFILLIILTRGKCCCTLHLEKLFNLKKQKSFFFFRMRREDLHCPFSSCRSPKRLATWRGFRRWQ